MTFEIQAATDTLDVSIITTCYGRNRHLYNLLSSLAKGSLRPAEVIIVNDDADPKRLAKYPLNIVQVPTSNHRDTIKKTGFDIGHNRNLGAAQASYDNLIFLDVDCIVATTFVEKLTEKLRAHSQALLMGQPCYLTRPLTDKECEQLYSGAMSDIALNALSVLNPYRHNIITHLSESEVDIKLERTQDYGAFWSLCFAINRIQFERIGGFDTHYVGYGSEDTDFAFMARAFDIHFYLTADVVYHQQHSVYRPPLNHLSSIVVNANRFFEKWQHWPMSGWLESFATMHIIDWQAGQQQPITIRRQPTAAEIAAAHCPDAAYV